MSWTSLGVEDVFAITVFQLGFELGRERVHQVVHFVSKVGQCLLSHGNCFCQPTPSIISSHRKKYNNKLCIIVKVDIGIKLTSRQNAKGNCMYVLQ